MSSWARPRIRLVVGSAIVALALAGGALATIGVEELVYGLNEPFGFDEEGQPTAEELHRGSVPYLVCVAISTPVLLTLALCLGVLRTSWVGTRTSAACAVLGWLNCPASLVLHAFLFSNGEPWSSAAGALFTGLIFGLVFATPFGVLYGAVSIFATKRLRSLLDRPTLSAKIDALTTVAITVLGAATFATLIAAARREPIVPWQAPALLAAVAALSLSLALLRARWLQKLMHDPARAGLHRVSLDELGVDPAALLPLHPGVAPTASHALVRVLPASGDGAYRQAPARVAVALVD